MSKRKKIKLLKRVNRVLNDQIDKLVLNHFSSNEVKDLNQEIGILKHELEESERWKDAVVDTWKQSNDRLQDEIQELKGIVSSEMRKNRELEKEIEELRSQRDTYVPEINPHDSGSVTQPAGTTPVVPLSCTPGWGQLGFLDPWAEFRPVKPVSTSNDSNSQGYTDGVLDGRTQWDDYHTGG
jgi:hypothetical protein